jgi:hypothetical protein
MTDREREIASQMRSSEQSSWLIYPQSGEIGMRLSIIGQVNELTPEAVRALKEIMVQIQAIDDFTIADNTSNTSQPCPKLKTCAEYGGPCQRLTDCGQFFSLPPVRPA